MQKKFIFTALKRSCGNVMFLHLSVILFTGGSGGIFYVLSELFNIAVDDFDAEKPARSSRVLVVTELFVSRNPVYNDTRLADHHCQWVCPRCGSRIWSRGGPSF